MYVVIIVIIINALSFFLVSRNRKGVINHGVCQTKNGQTTTYLIGDVSSHSRPFNWLLDEDSPIMGGVHVVDYQNFGFNPKVAAKQIGYDIFNRSRAGIIIAMSVGAKIPQYLSSQFRTIVIDPVYGRQSLRRHNKKIYHFIIIVLEVIVFVLGWLAYLPLVRIGSKRRSLALLVDWAYWGTAEFDEEKIAVDGLIVSSYDHVVDSAWVSEHVQVYQESCRRRIPCRRTDVDENGAIYAADLGLILQKVANGFRVLRWQAYSP